jgi:hypothetical protein
MKVRTKLDSERLRKKQQGEGQEYLDTITQPDEQKAADAIIETQKVAEKETNEDKIRKIEELEKSRQRKKADYILKLASTTNEMFKHVDLPMGYTYWIGFNKEKMNITITSPDGRKFGRGIKPCGITEYDFHAIGVLLTQCENTIDQIEERGAFRKDGIILPK